MPIRQQSNRRGAGKRESRRAREPKKSATGNKTRGRAVLREETRPGAARGTGTPACAAPKRGTQDMSQKKKDEIQFDHNHDGIDRRGFLKCMAWAGTGTLCVMQGGVLKSYSLSQLGQLGAKQASGELSFVQISDSHMGFSKAANQDVAETLKAAVAKINALPVAPEFLLHTGDISHLSKPEEFDAVDQILKTAKARDVFFVPGEHDVLSDNGEIYHERYGKQTRGDGWYSFDKNGVHFVGL